MKIKVMSIFVDDQDKALRFYTAVSYTHLDVYKRQMLAWSAWARFFKSSATFFQECSSIRMQPFIRVRSLMA